MSENSMSEVKMLLAQMRGKLSITCKRNEDVDLLRFLQAQRGDVGKAVEHYTAFSVWHRDYCSKLTVASPGVAAELRKGYLKFDPKATDKLGRPLLVFIGSHFHPKTIGDVHNLENALSYIQDRIADEIVNRTAHIVDRDDAFNVSQYLCVCDLQGFGMRNFHSKIDKTALDLMNHMYPGMMATPTVCVSTPWLLRMAWNVAAPLLSPQTHRNLILLPGNAAAAYSFAQKLTAGVSEGSHAYADATGEDDAVAKLKEEEEDEKKQEEDNNVSEHEDQDGEENSGTKGTEEQEGATSSSGSGSGNRSTGSPTKQLGLFASRLKGYTNSASKSISSISGGSISSSISSLSTSVSTSVSKGITSLGSSSTASVTGAISARGVSLGQALRSSMISKGEGGSSGGTGAGASAVPPSQSLVLAELLAPSQLPPQLGTVLAAADVDGAGADSAVSGSVANAEAEEVGESEKGVSGGDSGSDCGAGTGSGIAGVGDPPLRTCTYDLEAWLQGRARIEGVTVPPLGEEPIVGKTEDGSESESAKAAGASQYTTHTGVLWKRGGGGTFGSLKWKQRFFVLQVVPLQSSSPSAESSAEDLTKQQGGRQQAQLLYFTGSDAKGPNRVIALTTFKIEHRMDWPPSKLSHPHFAFAVVTPARTYELAAKTSDSRAAWVAELSACRPSQAAANENLEVSKLEELKQAMEDARAELMD